MDTGDNFWEETDVKGFDFDDDEFVATKMCGISLGGTARLSEQIKAGLGSITFDFQGFNAPDETPQQLNLHELIDEKVLDALLSSDNANLSFNSNEEYSSEKEELRILRRQVQSRWTPPDADSLMRKIMTGQPYSFEQCRSLTSKEELLKAAVSLGDGDAILMVVLFLSQTLNKSLFGRILSTSPIAVQHYVSYLSIRMQIQEVTDLLVMLGNTREASMKYFDFANSSPPRQLRRLRVCARDHFNNMKEKQIVENSIKLLEWEENVKKSVGESVSDCLRYACEHHWNNQDSLSPFTLAQVQGASNRLLHWIALNVKGAAGSWSDIDFLFITKGWLGNQRVKTELPIDLVVTKLHEMNAPKGTLKMYLELMDNLEKRLETAKRIQCHETVIEVYMAQKDRVAILKYKANLPPQDASFADNALKAAIKWKN